MRTQRRSSHLLGRLQVVHRAASGGGPRESERDPGLPITACEHATTKRNLKASRNPMGRPGGREEREISSRAARVTAALLALAAPATPAHQHLALARHGFTVSTFNVHCPAYRKLPCGQLELNHPERFIERQSRILRLPFWKSSDIVALQEFWYESPEITDMWVSALAPSFHLHGLQRGHARRGRKRPDGLLTAVSREWTVLSEVEIDYADVGDRCAQLLHVRRLSDRRELLVLNTHLLFPHNTASHRIQLREVHKALAAVAEYKRSLGERGLGRRPLPLIMCGDLNTPPRGEVAALLRSYGFVSSYHECTARRHSSERALQAVTHRAHTGALVSCDYILCANPSSPRAQPRRWVDVVFAELWAHLHALGCRDAADAFELLCNRDEVCVAARRDEEAADDDDELCSACDGPSFSSEAWLQTLTELGLGEACAHAAALTETEMAALHAHLDQNLNGRIDRDEWAASINKARKEFEGSGALAAGEGDCLGIPAGSAAADPLASAECAHVDFDITPLRSVLTPRCLMRGQWPGSVVKGGIGDDGEWLSDHGSLTTRFGFVQSAAQLDLAHGALHDHPEGEEGDWGGWGADGDSRAYDADYDDDRGDYDAEVGGGGEAAAAGAGSAAGSAGSLGKLHGTAQPLRAPAASSPGAAPSAAAGALASSFSRLQLSKTRLDARGGSAAAPAKANDDGTVDTDTITGTTTNGERR